MREREGEFLVPPFLKNLFRYAPEQLLTNVCSFDYEPAEYDFDDNEPEEFADNVGGAEEGGYAIVNGDGQPIQPGGDGETAGASADPNAVTGQGKVMLQQREKKVPNDERTTTPYMTKYERARVLGTRALQIR